MTLLPSLPSATLTFDLASNRTVMDPSQTFYSQLSRAFTSACRQCPTLA